MGEIREQRQRRERLIEDAKRVHEIYQSWPETRKQELLDWEALNLGPTSEWPGWLKYLGKPHPLAEGKS